MSWDRLYLFKAGKDCYGKRIYPRVVLDDATMEIVWHCVLYGLGRSDLVNLKMKYEELQNHLTTNEYVNFL